VSLQKTRGIVLHKVNFAESSVIVKIYTEQFGIQSYLVKGVRKKKPAVSPNLLQHLSLLDLVVYHKEQANIQHIKEVRSAFPFSHIPFDIRKSSLAIFMNEVIYKSLKEEEANPELFDFLFETVIRLDEIQDHLGSFHIWFCIQFSRYLGFYPSDNYDDQHGWFDLTEGIYLSSPPVHQHYLSRDISRVLFRISTTPFGEMQEIALSNPTRKNLLQGLLEYYRIHLHGFGDIQSHHILEQVLA